VFQNLTEGWESMADEVAATILFAAMYILTLGLVGICAVIANRPNLVLFYMCALIVSAVLLTYVTAYSFMFRDTFSQTIDIYNSAIRNLSLAMYQDATVAEIASNVTSQGLLRFSVITNCGVAGIWVVLIEIALCMALLGCTSAIASLVMIFNVVTGVSGAIFVLLSILICSWSAGNDWASAILCIAGTICAGLSFFGFKVAEVVLDFVKVTKLELARQDSAGASRRSPVPKIERTKFVMLHIATGHTYA